MQVYTAEDMAHSVATRVVAITLARAVQSPQSSYNTNQLRSNVSNESPAAAQNYLDHIDV